MDKKRIRNSLMYNSAKVTLYQNSLGPNVYGDLFTADTNNKIAAYIDGAMMHGANHKHTKKIAILVEPVVIAPHIYRWIEQNYNLFDMVLTHNKSLASKGKNFKYYPVWPRIWIPREDRKIYTKSKMVSAIFSRRNVTVGHKIRHEIARNFSAEIDLYGRAYKEINNKTEGIANYRYHVVVENERNGYASEKVNDCFCCGSIPIYWGNSNSNVLDYYDSEGIIMFENLSELKVILESVISEEHYASKLQSIQNNFLRAKNLTLDQIYWQYGINTFFNDAGERKNEF
jgi:hypothetical protein